MKDPLLSLLRLRQRALDNARRVVSQMLGAHNDAQLHLQHAEKTLERETRAASALDHGDGFVETFARWLPVGQAEVMRRRQAEREASTAVDRARIVVGLAHAATEAVEKLIEQRAAADAGAASRREQQELDEISRRRR